MPQADFEQAPDAFGVLVDQANPNPALGHPTGRGEGSEIGSGLRGPVSSDHRGDDRERRPEQHEHARHGEHQQSGRSPLLAAPAHGSPARGGT